MAAMRMWIDVIGTFKDCVRCGEEMWWVVGVCPTRNPSPGEFVRVDFDAAVSMAKDVLPPDDEDLIEQLRSRPTWQKGRGYNPNVCSACGSQEDWSTIDSLADDIVTANRDAVYMGSGLVPVPRWRAVRDAQGWVLCELPPSPDLPSTKD